MINDKRLLWQENYYHIIMSALIGIGGKMGAGKTLCASMLVKDHGYKEIAFADVLKRICKELFILDDRQLYGTLLDKQTVDPRWGCSSRHILQVVGTDLLRNRLCDKIPNIGHNIFCMHFYYLYQTIIAEDKDAKIVISDVRFINEIDMIHSLGGTTWYIERDTVCNKIDNVATQQSALHESENSVIPDQFMSVLTNNGSIECLTGMVNDLVNIKDKRNSE